MRVGHEAARFPLPLGGAAVAWPGEREQANPLPVTIGFLWRKYAGANRSHGSRHCTSALAGDARLGWIDGRTVTIEYRWGEGRSERAAEIAAEFAPLAKVDVIVTSSNSDGRDKAGDLRKSPLCLHRQETRLVTV